MLFNFFGKKKDEIENTAEKLEEEYKSRRGFIDKIKTKIANLKIIDFFYSESKIIEYNNDEKSFVVFVNIESDKYEAILCDDLIKFDERVRFYKLKDSPYWIKVSFVNLKDFYRPISIKKSNFIEFIKLYEPCELLLERLKAERKTFYNEKFNFRHKTNPNEELHKNRLNLNEDILIEFLNNYDPDVNLYFGQTLLNGE